MSMEYYLEYFLRVFLFLTQTRQLNSLWDESASELEVEESGVVILLLLRPGMPTPGKTGTGFGEGRRTGTAAMSISTVPV